MDARITLDLPCRLTQEELRERSRSLALANEQFVEVEIARDDAAKQFKTRLTKIDGEVVRLARIVRDEAEPRPVECRKVGDFVRGLVETIRLDTGEVVHTRAMEEGERQRAIFDPAPDPVAAGREALASTVPEGSTLTVAVDGAKVEIAGTGKRRKPAGQAQA